MSVTYSLGMRPLGKVKIEWSPEFAYAIGLLVTDGCLYSDGRHIGLVSRDVEQLINFLRCLGLKNKIGSHVSGIGGSAFKIQFSDISFYNFLLQIGLMPKKSKIIREVKIPREYFFDFLRGCFDGDGSFYSYWDPRWRSSFMFYTSFASASPAHIEWLQEVIRGFLGIKGYIGKNATNSVRQLKYGKAESLILLPKVYYNPAVVCLSRKRTKIEEALKIEGKRL
jgi:hypothetical protein